MHCYASEGKGPQPVAMVAGATYLPNHMSECRTTRGSATCLWSWREPKGARLISAQQWAWMSAHTMAGALNSSRALAAGIFSSLHSEVLGSGLRNLSFSTRLPFWLIKDENDLMGGWRRARQPSLQGKTHSKSSYAVADITSNFSPSPISLNTLPCYYSTFSILFTYFPSTHSVEFLGLLCSCSDCPVSRGVVVKAVFPPP